MIIPLIILALSLIITSVMLTTQVRKIRGGQITINENLLSKSPHLPKINPKEIGHIITKETKETLHNLIIISIRNWVKLANITKKLSIIVKEKINKILKVKTAIEQNQTASSFLHKISEYRKHLKEVHKKIKKEEENKMG